MTNPDAVFMENHWRTLSPLSRIQMCIKCCSYYLLFGFGWLVCFVDGGSFVVAFCGVVCCFCYNLDMEFLFKN